MIDLVTYFFGSIFEFAHTLTQATSQFGNTTCTKENQDYHQDQDNLRSP